MYRIAAISSLSIDIVSFLKVNSSFILPFISFKLFTEKRGIDMFSNLGICLSDAKTIVASLCFIITSICGAVKSGKIGTITAPNEVTAR